MKASFKTIGKWFDSCLLDTIRSVGLGMLIAGIVCVAMSIKDTNTTFIGFAGMVLIIGIVLTSNGR